MPGIEWAHWRKLERVIPLLTIAAAGGVEILAALQVPHFKLSLGEHVTIILLGLLAIDSLIERIKILEDIKDRIEIGPKISPLRKRSEMPPVSDQTDGASEILLLAVSGVGLIEGHLPIFRRLLQEGCNFRVIILDPESPYVDTWSEVVGASSTKQEIESVQSVFRNITSSASCRGRCEIVLSRTPPTFSLFAINPRTEGGSMCIDFHTLDIRLAERPLISLKRRYHREWFDLFVSQFELAWERAMAQNPAASTDHKAPFPGR
jgi:hypothetical protein